MPDSWHEVGEGKLCPAVIKLRVLLFLTILYGVVCCRVFVYQYI